MIAAGVWLCTQFVVDEYRKAMADPFVAFFTLLCVWAWVRAAHGGAERSAAPRSTGASRDAGRRCALPRRGVALILLFYVSLALGALSKGPVIFITVLLALVAIHLVRRRRPPGSWRAHLIGLILFLGISLPWPLYIMQHVPNALVIWRYESVGEVTGENVEKLRPWWMYLANSFQLPLPWTLVWIGGIVVTFVHGWRGVRSRRGQRRMIAILWQALTVGFFSLSGVKKPAYLLPVMPAQTLIVAEALVILLVFGRKWITKKGGNTHPALSRILALAQALIGVGFALGMSVVLLRGTLDRTVALVCGIVATLAALVALIPIARKSAKRWLAIQVFAYAIILIVLLGVQQPDVENHRSARKFAAGLTEYLHTSNLPLMVHALPEDLAFYLPLDLPDADDLPHALLAIDHSPKDPPETLDSLSQTLGNAKVIDARPVSLKGVDSQGRWRLFEVTLERAVTRT